MTRPRFRPTPAGSIAAGYTLIELAITLTLAGLLSGMVFWGLGSSLGRARVNRVASTLASDLQYAQVTAARQRRPVVVIVDPSVRMYLIRDRANASLVFRRRFLGAGSEHGLDSLAATPATSVEIFPNGVARETTTFTVGLGGYARQVKLTRAGQVRLGG